MKGLNKLSSLAFEIRIYGLPFMVQGGQPLASVEQTVICGSGPVGYSKQFLCLERNRSKVRISPTFQLQGLGFKEDLLLLCFWYVLDKFEIKFYFWFFFSGLFSRGNGLG